MAVRKTYTDKLNDMWENLIMGLQMKASLSKKKSKHNGNPCLVDGKCNFNLDGGRYLTELTQKVLIDNKGYEYGYDVLSMEQLCELADELL